MDTDILKKKSVENKNKNRVAYTMLALNTLPVRAQSV